MGDGVLEGKTAIVTGGARGMGREMAIAFAREGAAVAVTAAPGSDENREEIQGEIDATVADIQEIGGAALGLLADVASWDDCQRVVADTVDAFGGLGILVNNAGKSGRYVGTGGKRRIPFYEAKPDGYCEIIGTD